MRCGDSSRGGASSRSASRAGPPAGLRRRLSDTTGSTAARLRTGCRRASAPEPGDDVEGRLGRPSRPALDSALRRHRHQRPVSARLEGRLAVVPVGDGAGWDADFPVRTIDVATLAPAEGPVAAATPARRRSTTRPLARLLPARHPAEPSTRFPSRADGARPRQLDARLVASRPAPALGAARAGHGLVALRSRARTCRVSLREPGCGRVRARSRCRTSSRRPSCRSSSTARRQRIPIVAHVASWDHTVGKGVIAPFCDVYVVQNRTMLEDLVRYHDIPRERIVVTGWPQTGRLCETTRACRVRRPRPLVRSRSGDPARLVLVMGNTSTNAPYEDRFVERMVRWEAERGCLSLLFRPHPRDRAWRDRFAAARATEGVHVQEASFTDLEVLATSSDTPRPVSSRTRGRSCSRRSSTTDRPCACSTTRGHRPARAGR